jgi:photosystem II stability/assembly factor-like uncharacterized protein
MKRRVDAADEALRSVAVWGLLFVAAALFPAHAAPWRPLCPEGASCVNPLFFDPGIGSSALRQPLLAPFSTSGEVSLSYQGIYPSPTPPDYRLHFRIRPPRTAPEVLGNAGDIGAYQVSDLNTVVAPDGTLLVFDLYRVARMSPSGQVIEALNWTGLNPAQLNLAAFLGPPVVVQGIVHVGLRSPAGGVFFIYRSTDGGHTWSREMASIPIGDNRHHLSPNPEGTGLWAIIAERFSEIGFSGLWESLDHGKTWTRVDTGSFPANTRRVVHDPANPQVVYAASASGLHVSRDRARTWQPMYLREGVYGLAFVPQGTGRMLVLGTETGVQMSLDEGTNWQPMSAELFALPHSVISADGLLIAVSDAGYFTCPGANCMGEPTLIPPPGIALVTEYYNSLLDHYFITPDLAEAAFIDAGGAGPGWQRTGHGFKVWSKLGTDLGAHACRFYGSVFPGPNSHFFTLSPGECNFLIELQEQIPASQPRWNLEEYSFMAVPPDTNGACPTDLMPVYRAYNNGFPHKDSNHRFVTDRALFAPLIGQGWIDEGVAFCVPR